MKKTVYEQNCTSTEIIASKDRGSDGKYQMDDARITNVDARALSVNQLARAASLSWCHYHNALCTSVAPLVPEKKEFIHQMMYTKCIT